MKARSPFNVKDNDLKMMHNNTDLVEVRHTLLKNEMPNNQAVLFFAMKSGSYEVYFRLICQLWPKVLLTVVMRLPQIMASSLLGTCCHPLPPRPNNKKRWERGDEPDQIKSHGPCLRFQGEIFRFTLCTSSIPGTGTLSWMKTRMKKATTEKKLGYAGMPPPLPSQGRVGLVL